MGLLEGVVERARKSTLVQARHSERSPTPRPGPGQSGNANEASPFSYAVFPLEYIHEENYIEDDWEAAKENLKLFATTPKRYWVGRLNSLWSQGFNSAYPGKPVSAWGRRQWQLPEPDRRR